MTVSDISISSGIRSSLYNIQLNSARIERTQQRLSSGKSVNSPLDNPANYFASMNNINRAADILSRKDGIIEGIQTIRAAENGANAIVSLLASMKGLAEAALGTGDQGERDAYAASYTALQKQVTAVAKDASYRGVNLLNSDSLTMELSNQAGAATLTLSGSDATADGLGVGYLVIAGTGVMIPSQTTTFSGIRAHQANVEFTDSYNLGAVSQTTIDDSALQVIFDTNGTGTDEAMSFSASPVMRNGSLIVTGTVSQDMPPPAVPSVATYTRISWGGSLERTFPSFTASNNVAKVWVAGVEQSGNYIVDSNGSIVFTSSVPQPGEVVKVEKISAAVTWDSNGAISFSMKKVDTALETVRTIATSLSSSMNVVSTRLNFSSIMSQTLMEGADKLTRADMEQESAAMLMLQTRQNLGMTSLSLTSRTNQSILMLF